MKPSAVVLLLLVATLACTADTPPAAPPPPTTIEFRLPSGALNRRGEPVLVTSRVGVKLSADVVVNGVPQSGWARRSATVSPACWLVDSPLTVRTMGTTCAAGRLVTEFTRADGATVRDSVELRLQALCLLALIPAVSVDLVDATTGAPAAPGTTVVIAGPQRTDTTVVPLNVPATTAVHARQGAGAYAVRAWRPGRAVWSMDSIGVSEWDTCEGVNRRVTARV